MPDIYAVHVSGDPVEVVKDLPSRDSRYGPGLDTTVFDLSAVGPASPMKPDGSRGRRRYAILYRTLLKRLRCASCGLGGLAFISDPDRSIFWRESIGTGRGSIKYTATTRITVHEVATGESREIGLPAGYAAAPIRLEWSPSGDRIAFVVLEGEKSPWNLAVYIVGADGTGLMRVSDALSGPTWSPDGEELAMVVPEGDDEEALYIFATDGSNIVAGRHLSIGRQLGTDLSSGLWYGNLSWSPDGSRILVESSSRTGSVIPLGTAGADTGVPLVFDARSGAMTGGAGTGSILASPLTDTRGGFLNSAWSPDGAQIAVRYDIAEFFKLYVVDREGNTRVLLDWVREFR